MKRNLNVYILLFITFILGSYGQLLFWSLGTTYSYVIKPILWLILLTIVYLFYPKRNASFNFRRKAIIEYSLIAALTFVVFYYSLGLIVGFQHSAYDRSVTGIIKNIWMIFAFLIPREIIRDIFIKGTYKKNRKLIFILLTIIMSLTEIGYSNYLNSTSSIAGLIEVSIKTFLPSLGVNTFLTYLCYKEGYTSSLVYLLVIKLISIVIPIFPNEIFFLNIILEFLIPAFTYVKIEDFFERYRITTFEKDTSIISKICLVGFMVILLMYTTRLLPLMPTVILSNSMYPQIERGDMIISKKEYKEIKINDIIEYKQGNIYVIHRVVNILNTNNGKLYITKGDNNKYKDSLYVREEQITGVIVATIPKIGYPTIWMREFLESARGIEIEEGVR